MVLWYILISLSIATAVFFLRHVAAVKTLVVMQTLLQLAFTAYALLHKGSTDMLYFTYDAAGLLLLSTLSLIATASVYHGFRYFGRSITKHFFTYHSALVLLITFISLAYLANDITIVWILVEATTLAASVLIYHEKTKNSLEAAWKYIFLCSVGIAFAYIGILFIGISAKDGLSSGLSFNSIAIIASQANPSFLKIAFVFTLIGFSAKMELFPMHTAAIDANSVAPTPAAAIMSTGIVNLGFLAIFRIYAAFAHTSVFGWMNNILILTGLLSVVVAAGYMLKAKHNKRMLAYSTLENMGLAALALGLGGMAVYAAFFLLVMHALVKSSLFFQLGQVSRVLNTWKLDECGGYMKKNPAGALVLLLGMIALLAIPPSGSFVAEYFIFKELIETKSWIVFAITVLMLTALIYGFSTRVLHILFSESRTTDNMPQPRHLSVYETLTQFLFLALVFVACFYQPEYLNSLINEAISVLPK